MEIAGLAIPAVGVDGLQDGLGEFDGFQARDSVDQRGRAGADAVEEATKFKGQGVGGLDG